MNLYSRKQRWKLVLALLALAIVGASLWYSNRIVNKVRQEERRKVELWAEAVRNRAQLVNYTDSLFHRLRLEERKRVELWADAQVHLASDDVNDLSFYLKVVSENTTIPVIITDDKGRPVASRNVDPRVEHDSDSLRAEAARMDAAHEPIPITLYGSRRQYLHYKDSHIVTELEQVMDNIIRSFISETVMNTAAVPVIYTDSTRARVIEHSNIDPEVMADSMLLRARILAMGQANPPIEVSLMAWMELLKENGADPAAVGEMRKDVARLETITERFSKIGSAPDLVPENLDRTLRETVQYLRPRMPSRVKIDVAPPHNPDLAVPLNRALFSWVLENLIRNAVDAMEGEGSITIGTEQDGNKVHVDVTDTGKGIPASKAKTVFRPGYTTKKRGWGLGLSLTKRIMESYHKGKIFVKRSAPGKGTTFRITLRG